MKVQDLFENERDKAVEMLKQMHIAFEGGKNSDAQFWVTPDPQVNNVDLVFFHLPETNEFGAAVVYLNDEDFEEGEDPIAIAQRYGSWELKDFLEDNPDLKPYY